MTGRTVASLQRLPRDAVLAASLLAVDPAGIGGVLVKGPAGPLYDAFLALVRKLLPRRAWRKVPPQASLERLQGGLDLAGTLAAGKPVLDRGILAGADNGILTVAMAERLDSETAAVIAAALAERAVTVDRHGVHQALPARFCVIAHDEGREGDEQAPDVLSQRLAIHLALNGDGNQPERALEQRATAARVAMAQDLLPDVQVADEMIAALCNAAVTLGVRSLRAGPLSLSVARAHAAFDGRDHVGEEDVVAAGRLVLAPRATRLPAPPPEEAAEPPGDPPPQDRSEDAPAEDQSSADRPLDDVVLEAVLASLPRGLLDELAAGGAMRSRRAGRMGAAAKSLNRGRPIGSRRGSLGRGARLDILATLRVAAPWQPLRQHERGYGQHRIDVREDDYRIVRFRQRTGTTTIFAVDASGSQAVHRLSEAKGAVELLLADCYVRRDQVAVVAFRGAGAEVLLPPTRSLARAKRSLEALPGGGATPLAAGILAAMAVARAEMAQGRLPNVVLLTDGRGNVALSGEQGRPVAEADALAVSRLFRAEGYRAIVIDTAQRRSTGAETLAREMGARYVALPHADAERVSRAVQQLTHGRA